MPITIKDIARESGYAISTVSRVLNNHADVSREAKEKILAVVERHSFRLNSNAKHLKQRQAAGVAIIVKGTMNMLFSVVVEELQEQFRGTEYETTVHYLDEEEDEVVFAQQLCRERRPVGLCFLGGLTDNFRAGFDKITLPSVLVTMDGETLGFSNLSSVSVDDEAGAYSAVTSLLDYGHRNIAVIGGSIELSGPSGNRLAGCQRALAQHGITFDFSNQFEEARYDHQGGYTAMCHLLARIPDLTAVFCMSDVMAIGALRALSDSGKRVPQDLSLVGYDGVPMAHFSIPRLATVRQNAKEMARCSGDLLRNMISGGAPTQHIHIPYDYILGESIASPANL